MTIDNPNGFHTDAVQNRGRFIQVALLLATMVVTGCGLADSDTSFPTREGSRVDPNPGGAKRETVFGPGGFNIFRGDSDSEGGGGGSGIAVNSYLWRASLDTLSFMPLASADPFGGVIITDWYSPPETPEERFKMNVYILGRQLRADGVKVAVFRQIRDSYNDWSDSAITPNTPAELENAILTRARQLRIQTVEQ